MSLPLNTDTVSLKNNNYFVVCLHYYYYYYYHHHHHHHTSTVYISVHNPVHCYSTKSLAECMSTVVVKSTLTAAWCRHCTPLDSDRSNYIDNHATSFRSVSDGVQNLFRIFH